jgi:hypothetical protein
VIVACTVVGSSVLVLSISILESYLGAATEGPVHTERSAEEGKSKLLCGAIFAESCQWCSGGSNEVGEMLRQSDIFFSNDKAFRNEFKRETPQRNMF